MLTQPAVESSERVVVAMDPLDETQTAETALASECELEAEVVQPARRCT